MNVDFHLGSGIATKDYLVVGNEVIDKGDTPTIVKTKLGTPSRIGITLGGYKFYRYDKEKIEIHFDRNRVSSWKKLDVQP